MAKMMQLSYAGRFFPVGQCEVIPRMDTIRSPSGRPLTEVWTVNVNGMLTANTSEGIADLIAQVLRLEATLAIVGGDLVLTDSVAGPVLSFPSQGSEDGVQIETHSYPDGKAGEAVTHRKFSFTATVRYPASGSGLVSYQESLTITGTGGPVSVLQPAVSGEWPYVETSSHSSVRASQRGSAVGYSSCPDPASPLWPYPILKNMSAAITRGSPEFRGRMYVNYRIDWAYEFESAKPLAGTPSVFPRGS